MQDPTNDDRSKVYVAMSAIQTATPLTFHVTTTEGNRICTGTTNARLQNGFYYKTELSLKEQKDLEGVEIIPDLEWAIENVDGYFAWAETTGHPGDDGYSFNAFPPYDGDNGNASLGCYLKYAYDDKLILEPMDDAAHVNWGGDWRMATIDEWEQLVNATTQEYVEDYKETGVAGMVFTHKETSKQIFLPALGEISFANIGNRGQGYYWTSSHYTGSISIPAFLVRDRHDFSSYLHFNTETIADGFPNSYLIRKDGMCIRPVRNKKK